MDNNRSSLYVKKSKPFHKFGCFLLQKLLAVPFTIDHDTELGLNTVQSSF